MKTIKLLLSITLVAVLAFSCKNEAKPEVKTIEVETASESSKKLDPNANYAKAEFTIDGMTCQIGCAATIQKKLGKMEGVKSAVVDFDKRLAMVEYNDAKVTPASLEATVTKVADIYKVSDMKTVENFSNAAKTNDVKKACEEGCKKECCKAGVVKGEKMACKKDCKEACCTKKKEA